MKKRAKSKRSLLTQRKEDHLNLCRFNDVASLQNAGWESISLPHRALPEVNWDSISLETKFLGIDLKAPLIISSMTGGSPQGEKINLLLAQFAEHSGIAMGVGSQRIQLEEKNKKVFALRKKAPKAVLFANIGVVQFNYGVTSNDCQWLVDQLEASALILHCNPLQEAIQKEGDRNFSGLLKQIETLKKTLSVPVILKETGSGLDVESSRRAIEAGVDALDIAGLGGTHWGYIEGLRESSRKTQGDLFRDWGIPTPMALKRLRLALQRPDIPLIASGGVRSGLDAAKAHYLGADLCGMALPFLKASRSFTALEKTLAEFAESLRIALFCTGSVNIESLKAKGPLYEK